VSLPVAWVVGRGGLLGSPVERALGRGSDCDLWWPERPIIWGDRARFAESQSEAVRGFAARVLSQAAPSWTICWCAGAGVVGTSADALALETASFGVFLERLGAEPGLASRPGLIFLASSAGGVYGGSLEHRISEASRSCPISDYGRAKLAQEELLEAWVRVRQGVSTLIGRFANLYGPGQRLDKPQGLISQMSRCMIFGIPIHIFVSLDTIRDYLFSEDAGRMVASGLARLRRESATASRQVVKIYGSEREISVAGLIGAFRRIARRQLRVVLGLHRVGTQQPLRLLFRSQMWRDEDPSPQIDLFEGVHRVYQHQLLLFQAGRLPPPAHLGRAAP
jgi:NAD dependent epimerase/dehydratase family